VRSKPLRQGGRLRLEEEQGVEADTEQPPSGPRTRVRSRFSGTYMREIWVQFR
jgi:hypothetical protein